MAYVLSSVSGNLISAASAGYAPTNSADVSAIASAYQVVSSTATQLYAGTAYLTSVNEATISAARAGQAANASLATSAYYDGTGRLISSLPDGAEVSAIASSYVESGVSSKQDTLSFAYNTADQISSINGSALGGMDEAAVSGIASSYAESAVSSKADSSALSSYALSADVSGTVDLVSTQSANWGGSALALSAGPGVKFEKSGNVLVASTDETVLWSNNNGAATFTASEVVTNFERIAVYVTDNPSSESIQRVEIPMMGDNLTAPKFSLVSQWDSSWRVLMWWVKLTSSDMMSFSISSAGYAGALANSSWSNGNEPNYFRFYKVVGINRISGA